MRKILSVICIVIAVLMAFTLTTYAEENTDENMDNQKNEIVEYSAMEVEDSIKVAIGVKSNQNIVRIYNIPIVFAFNAYDTIEEVLKSDYVEKPYYVVVTDGNIVSAHKLLDDGLNMVKITDSMIQRDSDTVSVLLNGVILEKLPKKATVLDVYYLWGCSNHQGAALYYKTDMGDFVYYRYYQTGREQYLFPANDFFDFMKAVYETMGTDTPPGGMDIESVWDLSKYEIDLNMNRSNRSKWANMYRGASILILVAGGVGTGLFIRKKKKAIKTSAAENRSKFE